MTVTLTLTLPDDCCPRAGDDIKNTVDYWRVSRSVQELARTGTRNLVETLAEEIAASTISEYRVEAVEVELRKYVLADARWVAVRIRRERKRQA